ncbi:MAG: alpha/beta hydrolase [Kiritimatiellae bacterium]|nr:alpha/beta hydrolase [Kiritimatiellia bacterium]
MNPASAIFLIVLTLSALRLLVWWTEVRLLYPRRRDFCAEPEDEGLEYEDVSFCAEDGAKLHGWWFPHPEAKGVMLVCHGNAGNVSDRLWIPLDLADVPLHKFVFDYRGFGRSRGFPSERGTERDVRAALEVVRQRWKTHGETPPVILYGRSLGGGVALQIAEDPCIRGLVLENTFTSVLEIGERHYPWLFPRLFCVNPYRSDLRIEKVSARILVAHSPDDEVIPYDMGETLFRMAPNPWKFIRLQGLHDDAGWQTSAEYAREFRRFVAEVLEDRA